MRDIDQPFRTRESLQGRLHGYFILRLAFQAVALDSGVTALRPAFQFTYPAAQLLAMLGLFVCTLVPGLFYSQRVLSAKHDGLPFSRLADKGSGYNNEQQNEFVCHTNLRITYRRGSSHSGNISRQFKVSGRPGGLGPSVCSVYNKTYLNIPHGCEAGYPR